MQITIDTMKDSHEDIRNAAGFLLHLIGDLNDDPNDLAAHTHNDTVATGPTVAPSAAAQGAAITSTTIPTPPTVPVPVSNTFVPPPPPLVPADSNSVEGDDEETNTSNVLPFPVPPPPPPPPTAGTAATTIPAPPAPSAGAATTVASANPLEGQVDAFNMPYDKRIHQKTGNKKKDGSWKLIKGIDPAVVAAVTAELAASKGATAPVSLPATITVGGVPVPPVPPAVPTAASGVPAPPAPPVVPIPPVAAVGAVSPYRALIERITTATKEGKITPARVNELCQANGVPNLMQLNNMPDKIDIVGTMIDAAIAGLA